MDVLVWSGPRERMLGVDIMLSFSLQELAAEALK
jgi:hypothetical protein